MNGCCCVPKMARKIPTPNTKSIIHIWYYAHYSFVLQKMQGKVLEAHTQITFFGVHLQLRWNLWLVR